LNRNQAGIILLCYDSDLQEMWGFPHALSDGIRRGMKSPAAIFSFVKPFISDLKFLFCNISLLLHTATVWLKRT